MDVFNRLRTTVSNLSTVLPGNPVTREYEIVKHVGSAGPGLLWKVYQAIKRSTKEEAAVFVLEKKQLERYSKRDRELVAEILKQGVAQLTRLRHPSILTVQHPMEESRESLAFATEPAFCSLANILGQTENMPVPPPPELKDYQLFDVEIKYGFLQVSWPSEGKLGRLADGQLNCKRARGPAILGQRLPNVAELPERGATSPHPIYMCNYI